MPALFTGIGVAALPKKIYHDGRYRMLAGGLTVIVMTMLYCCIAVLFMPQLNYMLPLLIISALPSGMVMGLLTLRLPPRIVLHQ
uniref:hypothetical protein n=1 Tax=Salmonella enterica TaxID=28901 RepID=UPI003A918F70